MITKENKIRRAEEITNLVNTHKVIGVISLHRLSAATLLNIKKALAGNAILRCGRKSTMLHGIRKSSKNLEKLEEYISGPCGLLFSNTSPFALFKLIKANRVPTSAKVGEIAPEDIIIPAGPTQLPPGPAISSLQKIGLKTRVEAGKISILEQKTICKAGQPITEDMVAVFALLKIAPLKKGIEVLALWEDGTVYPKEILDINVEDYIAEIEKCAGYALNLAVNINYPTPESIPFLLRKAYDQACALCIESGFVEKDFVTRIIANAVMVAETLAKV